MEGDHLSKYHMDEDNQELSHFDSEPDLGKPLFKEDVFDTLLGDKNPNDTEPDTQFIPKTDIFAVKEATKTTRSVDFSTEKQAIQAEYDLVAAIVAPLKISEETKQELINFAVDFYDITPENALKYTKEASHELSEQMRDLLESQGLYIDYNGVIKEDNPINIPLLKNPETRATVGAYRELIALDSFVDKQLDEKEIEQEGEYLFEAISKHNIDSSVEEQIVGTALEKIRNNKSKITPENADAFILKTADYLKTHILVHLLHKGFGTTDQGDLTLPQDKEKLLQDPALRGHIETLKGVYKITDPKRYGNNETLKVFLTENSSVDQTENKKSTAENLQQSLEQLGFSSADIKTALTPEVMEHLGQSTINTLGTDKLGFLGFNQVIGRSIEAIAQKGGFGLDANHEPILSENWLQKNFLFWNKAKRLADTKNSPEYKKILDLVKLQKEILKKEEESKKQIAKNSGTAIINVHNPVVRTTKAPARTLKSTALAGAAAGIIAAGGVLLNEQDEEAAVENPVQKENNPTQADRIIIKNKPDQTDKLEKARKAQERPTLIETPTLPAMPVVSAQIKESESIRERATIEEPIQINPKNKVDARFANTTFKKPGSLGRRKVPSPDFKIDPFTYQSTDPNTAPKLERPQDMYPIDAVPDLDNPQSPNKRTARKKELAAEPEPEPEVVYQDNRLPRTEQKPEMPVAMPDLSSFRKKAKEPSVAEKTRLAREKVVQALSNQDDDTETELEKEEVEVKKDQTPEERDETNFKRFESTYELSDKVLYLANQVSRLNVDRELTQERAHRSGQPFNAASWDQGSKSIKAQFEKTWAEFSTKKLKALESGEEYLASLEKKLSAKPDFKTAKKIEKEINEMKEKLFFYNKVFNKTKDDLLMTPEEATLKQRNVIEELKLKREAKEAEEAERQKIVELKRQKNSELYPILKPIKKKSKPTDQDLPTKRAA